MHRSLACRPVQPGQTLAVRRRQGTGRSLKARGARPELLELPPLHVVWEDSHMACIVKPQDVPTQVQPCHQIQFTLSESANEKRLSDSADDLAQFRVVLDALDVGSLTV